LPNAHNRRCHSTTTQAFLSVFYFSHSDRFLYATHQEHVVCSCCCSRLIKICKKPKKVHYKNAVCSSTTILSPVCDEMSASRSATCLSLFLFFFFSCKSRDTKFLFCLPILIPQRKPGRICLDQIQIQCRLCAYAFVENPAI
jgi:hypothetical protein